MTTKTRSILLAAVLATPLAMLATPVQAQYRVDNGAALDANNRIGSNGSNGGGRQYQFNQGDAIVTGNVTAGREFRGNTSTTDPRAFRANTAGGNVDRFTKQSSSAYDNNAQNVRRYYGTSEGTPPPQGFGQQQIGSSGFVQTPTPTRSPGDLRVGDVYSNDALGFSAAPRPGELMMPGPVDNSNSQSLLRASPLYGVVQEDASTDPLQPGFKNFRRQQNGLNDEQMQKARREMNQGAEPSAKEGDLNANSTLNIGANSAIDKPFESPLSAPLAGPTLDNSNLASTRMNGEVKPEQSVRNELVPAPEQSTQYKELQSRFKKLKPGTVTDQEANQQFQQEMRQRDDQLKKSTKPGQGAGGSGTSSVRRTPGSVGGGGSAVVIPRSGGGMPSTPAPTPETPSTAVPPTAVAPANPAVESPKVAETPKVPAVAIKPGGEEAPDLNTESIKPGQALKVDTLTEGMKSSRVKDMLGRAEELMREQKFTGAIEQYDFAERVVPNNPLITLGRAHAELGASYYARAENNIRRAYNADNALLMAQFNMDKFLGKERLAFLEKDLKQVTAEETAQARAPFLLAYLKYHTGDKKMAANYLALSEKRLGKEDELYKLMRLHWDLPKADPIPDDLNK